MTTLLRIVIALLILYIAGLFVFAMKVRNWENPTLQNYDAIIVLTGDNGRIDAGIELQKMGVADELYISGVGWQMAERRNLTIGREAKDTYGNAKEIAQWQQQHNLINVVLVTSDYHILRAIQTIENATDNLYITPYAVDSLHRSRDSYYWLIFAEYNKLLFVWLEGVL